MSTATVVEKTIVGTQAPQTRVEPNAIIIENGIERLVRLVRASGYLGCTFQTENGALLQGDCRQIRRFLKS